MSIELEIRRGVHMGVAQIAKLEGMHHACSVCGTTLHYGSQGVKQPANKVADS